MVAWVLAFPLAHGDHEDQAYDHASWAHGVHVGVGLVDPSS